jgi:hypothetical protein
MNSYRRNGLRAFYKRLIICRSQNSHVTEGAKLWNEAKNQMGPDLIA